MKRIIFLVTIAILATMSIMANDQKHRGHKMPRPHKPVALTMPAALKAGDKIAIISPCGLGALNLLSVHTRWPSATCMPVLSRSVAPT